MCQGLLRVFVFPLRVHFLLLQLRRDRVRHLHGIDIAIENVQIHEALKRFTLPTYHEIPDVGLYLDQVAKYMNSFMIDFPEMNVTPSMISNYAKQKLIDRHQAGDNFRREFLEKESEPTDEIRIVRSKRFDIKPMYPEDACVQMELLGHSFYVFCNAETDQVNVVYKRKGGTYGLIEPEA